jgi:hypothetical protein
MSDMKDSHIIVDENSDDEMFSSDNTDNSVKQENKDYKSDFEKQCELLIEKITNNYREQRDEIRNLIKLHKRDMKALGKNKSNKNPKDKTGFTKPSVVPDKLADFVGIKKGTELPRTELTGLIFQEFKKRGLYHKKDKRIIVPDNDVKKLFNLPKDADKSTNPKDINGLNFFNLQKYIAKCYNEFNNSNQIKSTELTIDDTKHDNNTTKKSYANKN